MYALPRQPLTPEDVRAVAQGAKVRLSGKGLRLVTQGRRRIARIISQGVPVYGINTGFGALANRTVPLDKLIQLQENLIRSHAVGSGKLLDPDVVRGAMFLRANMLSKGFSGVSCQLVEQILGLLNRNVTPAVPESGSVGASGDLAPLAHVALVLIGRGAAFCNGRLMPGHRALDAVGLKPYKLQPKEGLALINGTEVMSACAVLFLLRAEEAVDLADMVASMSCAALGANTRVFEPELQALKPHAGQICTAKNLRSWLRGFSPPKSLVQDAYSLRCIPQVHGGARDGIAFLRQVTQTEMNAVTDNPVLIGSNAVSCGNFHGSAIALALDTAAIALTQLATISERRVFRLLDPNLSGLPAFLVSEPGLNSGYMILQLLAASLVTDCRILSTPASIQSLPTSANQEDHVSMGMNAAVKAREILDRFQTILAIELLSACQGLELSRNPVPERLRPILRRVRSVVPRLEQDRELGPDIEKVKGLLATLS